MIEFGNIVSSEYCIKTCVVCRLSKYGDWNTKNSNKEIKKEKAKNRKKTKTAVH